MLSIKLITSQNIAVHAINIDIGFAPSGDKYLKMARRASMAGATFEVIDMRQKYIDEVLFNPKYGYGKAFNACIDCHGFMFRTAFSLLEKYGASFVISGEVLGQRPMSQRGDAMNSVKNLAGDFGGLIVRPMCAKLLPATLPEINGWIDRQKLEGVSGRGRSRQMELAAQFGFEDYETPGGGCPFTLAAFADKIRDFIAYEGKDKMGADELQSLRFGRHLRLTNGSKMIIGRDEAENGSLAALNLKNMVKVEHGEVGALSLISSVATSNDKKLAAALALAYAKTDINKSYDVKIGSEIITSKPLDKAVAQEFIIK